MRDKQSLLRNHQASFQNIEAQLGKLTTLVNERLSPQVLDKKPQPHVMAIETEEDTIAEFLEALEKEPIQLEPWQKKSEVKEKFFCWILDITTWSFNFHDVDIA